MFQTDEVAAEWNNRERRRSNQELADFASVAAHELRSPLQAISGFAFLLESHCGPSLDESGRDFVRWILASAARMEALIDELLAYARVGTGPLVVGPADLNAIVADVVAALEADIATTGATVSWDSLPVTVGDPAQLAQLLQNLVVNSLKFADLGTAPVVHIGAEETARGWCIAVADNGIGVEPADRTEIFEMFHRLHPQSRYSGTGIGLAICRRIVETAGGRIWVDDGPASLDGKGSTFRFTIPAEP